MKIGIIGSGNIGSALARLWVEAGHEVIVSSKFRRSAERLARRLGLRATVGTPEEAARQGEVVLLAIPLGEVPQLAAEIGEAFQDKILMDTCNPYPERDGEVAREILKSGRGTGIWTARQFPRARVVRAFNSVHAMTFESQSRRRGEPVGVPLASDDPEAMWVVAGLVRDAGFGPVVVGGLAQARLFDPGSATYGSDLSDKDLRVQLGVGGLNAA